jgi:hypothetical protein
MALFPNLSSTVFTALAVSGILCRIPSSFWGFVTVLMQSDAGSRDTVERLFGGNDEVPSSLSHLAL